MSFSVTFSGHHNDADKTAQIEDAIVSRLTKLIGNILAIDPDISSLTCNFSGATRSVDVVKEVRNARAGVVDEAKPKGGRGGG